MMKVINIKSVENGYIVTEGAYTQTFEIKPEFVFPTLDELYVWISDNLD